MKVEIVTVRRNVEKSKFHKQAVIWDGGWSTLKTGEKCSLFYVEEGHEFPEGEFEMEVRGEHGWFPALEKGVRIAPEKSGPSYDRHRFHRTLNRGD